MTAKASRRIAETAFALVTTRPAQRVTPQTRSTITAADLVAMQSRALLINTSRAGLIAPGALLAGLNAGRPGLAALDVFDIEPPRSHRSVAEPS